MERKKLLCNRFATLALTMLSATTVLISVNSSAESKLSPLAAAAEANSQSKITIPNVSQAADRKQVLDQLKSLTPEQNKRFAEQRKAKFDALQKACNNKSHGQKVRVKVANNKVIKGTCKLRFIPESRQD